MRFFVCSLLLPLFLLTPVPQSPATFPISADMHEIWPGVKLSDADTQLLRKAVESDLRDLDEEALAEKKNTFASVDTADLPLGELAKGVIVLMSGSPMCGNGGCPIYAYVREKSRYRKVLGDKRKGPGGWAFGVINTNLEVPDLVIASNLSGGVIVLTLYRYSGKTFTSEGCETLTAKEGAPSGRSRFDPAAVVISPCGTQAP